MQDIKLYLEKLRSDAEDCLTISETAASDAKREVFKTLAATYQKLAADLEKIIALNLISTRPTRAALFERDISRSM